MKPCTEAPGPIVNTLGAHWTTRRWTPTPEEAIERLVDELRAEHPDLDSEEYRRKVWELPSVPTEPIRRRLGLTQASFARVFGLSVATVRDWEQGRRTPEGPARTLLEVIARHPEIVHEVLSNPRA